MDRASMYQPFTATLAACDQAAIGSGAMPPTSLQQCDCYAFRASVGGWMGDDDANLGIRVGAVVEPGTGALLGQGLGELALLRRRRR